MVKENIFDIAQYLNSRVILLFYFSFIQCYKYLIPEVTVLKQANKIHIVKYDSIKMRCNLCTTYAFIHIYIIFIKYV